jgi:3-deoxy-D-manno-octulosonic acid kinase
MSDAHIEYRACGIVVCDPVLRGAVSDAWFDRSDWEAHNARRHTSTGRSPVLIRDVGNETWVLRHYSRGGLVARLIEDHYLWLGLRRTRAYREWALLRQMQHWGLPAPAPIAACVQRNGLVYRADIITRYLPDTETLSAYLRRDGVPPEVWQSIGRMVSSFHDCGVDHPDLTAHNILVDTDGCVYLVDFDNAFVRPRGHWRERGIARLERSLRKVALETGTAFDESAWQLTVEAYRATIGS